MVALTQTANSAQLVGAPNPLYLDVADRIGNRLCRDAIWDHARCNWLGWSMEFAQQRRSAVYQACGPELYSGTSGIALFLAELFRFTGDKQQLRCLEGAVNQALSMYERIPSSTRHGFYSGVCGIAFAMIRIGEILERDLLIERGLTIILSLRDVALDVNNIDVIGGSAGAIPVLLSLAKKYQKDALLDLAFAHGQHLVRLAEHSAHGVSWRTISNSVKANLTGYAHGNAGMVNALLELFQVTGESEYLHTAHAGLQYEAQWFHQSESNWEDLRQMGQADGNCSMGWCHGAPGIGLARLRLLELLQTNKSSPTHADEALTTALRYDLDAAITSTAGALSRPWTPGTSNYSLCHGAAGNAELMLKAAQYLQQPELRAIADKVGQEGHEFYVRQGLPWPCGNAGAGETPNLMLGIAGIGHFYLRLYDSPKVSSILLLTAECS